MKKLKMLSIPVLLGALLMATLVGVAGARPSAKPEASPALVNYTFSPYHCIPRVHYDWGYGAGELHCNSGACRFHCPIKPPHQGLIRVQRLAMYAYDNDGLLTVNLTLVQLYPKTGAYVTRLGWQWTSDNPADPAVYAYNPPNFKVSVLQDIQVIVEIPANGQKLYGFKVKYEPL